MTRVAITLLVTLLVAACKPASGPAAKPTPSANAWAVVNGKEITKDDVDKAYRRAAPDGVQPSQEEMYTAKLNLLNDMIVQELLIAQAAALKVELPQAELDKEIGRAHV